MANKSKKSKAQVKPKVTGKAKAAVKAKSKPVVKAKAQTKPKPKPKAKVATKKKPVQKAKVASKKAVVKKASAKKAAVPKKVQTSKKSVSKPVAAKKITANKMDSTPKKVLKITDYSKAITPLADRLVIRVVQAEKVTPGGIIIPDTVSTVAGHLEGEVLAVGHGSKNKKGFIKPLDVKIGDFVLFAEYSGTPVEFNSEELQIIKESDVMGIVQK